MKLIGMLDSPFVRRVAVTMLRQGFAYEHLDWSVGRDFARIIEYSPLGRVPTLVLDDGETLTESAAILDYLDELAGPGKALLPAGGHARRHALRLMSYAIGAAEKGREQIYEHVMRPAELRHEPWVARCRSQMHGALGLLESECRKRGEGEWLIGSHLGQADITLACAFTFLSEALGLTSESARYPCVARLTARCEALPEFTTTHTPFFSPGA
ncbi:MAG: glutathione S-transferase family protein [Pseudomonadota bacterium]